MTSVVYFIEGAPEFLGGETAIKIGFSTNIQRRLTNITAQFKTKVKLLGLISGDRDKEKELHGLFSIHRYGKAEWFHPVPEIMGYIREYTHLNIPKHSIQRNNEIQLPPELHARLEEAVSKLEGYVQDDTNYLLENAKLRGKIEAYSEFLDRLSTELHNANLEIGRLAMEIRRLRARKQFTPPSPPAIPLSLYGLLSVHRAAPVSQLLDYQCGRLKPPQAG